MTVKDVKRLVRCPIGHFLKRYGTTGKDMMLQSIHSFLNMFKNKKQNKKTKKKKQKTKKNPAFFNSKGIFFQRINIDFKKKEKKIENTIGLSSRVKLHL